MENKREELLNNSIFKLFVKYFIPTLIGSIVVVLYNIVDRFFIGKINEKALAGAGITFYIVMLLIAFSMLIGVGSGTIVSLRLGKGNEEDAEKVFGIKAKATDVTSGKLNHEGYIDVAEQLTEMFGFKKVAITLRGSISANDNNWAAMLYSKGQALFSKNYLIHIVDRVGGGDSFAAGLIYGLVTGMPEQEALEFAVASSCLKHTIEGDANHVTVAEVKTLMGGDGSGRVQR